MEISIAQRPATVRDEHDVRAGAGGCWADGWLPWAGFLLALTPYVAFLWPDQRVLFGAGDYEFYQLPVHKFVRSELLQGRVPLWMPSIGCGTPLHASQQAAVAYPLLTPLLLLFSANYSLRLCLVLHAVIGYWGQYLLSRRLGLSPLAASFASLVFTLGAYSISHLLAGHVSHLFAYALLPWLWLSLDRLLARPGGRTAAALALVVSLLLLTGQPQLPYYACVFAGLWGLGSLAAGAASKQRLHVIGWSLIAGSVALLLISVQWLPWLELFDDGRWFSPRGSDMAFANEGAVRWPELVILFFPDAFGNPYSDIAGPSEWQMWLYHEKACYVGLATLGLMVIGLVRRQHYRWQLPMLILCAFALVIAMGDNLLVFEVTRIVLPGLTHFRDPGRAAALFCFFAPLLAAAGFEAILNRDALLRGRGALAALLVAGLLAAGLAVGALAQEGYLEYAQTNLMDSLIKSGLLAAASAGAMAGAWKLARLSPSAAAILLTGMVFLDLYLSQACLVGLSEPNTAENGRITPPPPGAGRFAVDPIYYGSLRYSRMVSVLGDGHLSSVVTNEGGVVPASLERLHIGLLDSEKQEALQQLGACDLLYDLEQRTWARQESALLRVRLAGELDLRQLQADARYVDLSPGQGAVELLEETPQSMVVQVCPASQALLVVADSFYPGWTATVDGQAAPIECIHDSFRAVAVPAGAHRVEFTYAPASFRWGSICSLLGLVALGLLLLLSFLPSPAARVFAVRCPRRALIL